MKLLFLYLVLSLTFLCSIFAETAFAKQVDLTPLQTPVKNQGNRDTCAYFAVAALLESTIKKLNGTEYDISEEFEIFRHKVLAPWRPQVEFGNTYELLNNFVHDRYFFTEDQLSYQKKSLDFSQPLSSADLEFLDLRKKNVPHIQYQGLQTRTLSQMWVNRPWSQIFQQELDLKNPVVVTLKIAAPHINDQKGTFIHTPEIDRDCTIGRISCAGHAVLLVGYDDQQKVFKFKNSWGPQWGAAGYGYATFDHVDQFSYDPLAVQFDRLLSPLVKVVNP